MNEPNSQNPNPTEPQPIPGEVIQGAPLRPGDKPEVTAVPQSEPNEIPTAPTQPTGQPIFGGQTAAAEAQSTPAAEAPITPAQPTPALATQFPADGARADGSPLDNEEKLFAALGYVGILALLPLLARRDSEYCQHHGRQALVIAVIFIFLEMFGGLVSSLGVLVVILRIVTIIGGFLLANKGQWFTIPGIYDLSLKLKLNK